MPEDNRRQLVAARSVQTLEAVQRVTGGNWDADAYHVMERRDNELIEEEILYGAGSSKFVYNFQIAGTSVTGISVVGARHLAAHYGGLKHRIVASVQKRGALFTFTSYPSADREMRVNTALLHDLEAEDDFYAAVIETTDIHTGNSVQVEVSESRFEHRRDGSRYERPNYQKIAQSKARRNAILDLIPQDIQLKWKAEMLKLGKNDVITDSVIDEKRRLVIGFAAKSALTLSREAIGQLTIEQITGLGDAAREGKLPAFAQAAQALGLLATGEGQEPARIATTPHDPETGEVKSTTKKATKPREGADDPRVAATPVNPTSTASGGAGEEAISGTTGSDAKPAQKSATPALFDE